jgi:hypothetical protein
VERSQQSIRVRHAPHWLVVRLPDLILISALLIAALRFIAPVAQLTDVWLYDESDYLFYGVTLLQNGPPTPDWAPLYALWYFGLSLFQPDRVALYYLNFQILCLLLPLVLYITLRRYAVPPVPAALAAFLLLIARANLPMWPRVSHFALLIVLGSLIAASFAHSRSSTFAIAAFGALLAAYARPDLALAAILLMLAALVMLVRERTRRRVGNPPLLIGLGLGSLGLIALLGPPVGDGYRSFAAFAQHFGLNWVRWTGSSLSPWTNPFEIIALAFGDVESVGGALRADPALFARHVGSNLARAPQAFFELFFLHANLLLPPDQQAREGWLTLLLSATGALFIGWWRRDEVRERLRTLAPLWIILGSYLPGLLIANLVIYPRNHYLLMLGILLLVGGMALLGRPSAPRAALTLPMSIALALLMVAALPPTTAVLPGTPTKPTLATLAFIAALPINGPVQMLEAEGGYNIYLGDQFNRVAEYAKDGPFDAWAAERRINMIVLSSRLENDSRLRDDPEWQRLLRDPAAQEYVVLPISGADRTLLVQQRLLEP